MSRNGVSIFCTFILILISFFFLPLSCLYAVDGSSPEDLTVMIIDENQKEILLEYSKFLDQYLNEHPDVLKESYVLRIGDSRYEKYRPYMQKLNEQSVQIAHDLNLDEDKVEIELIDYPSTDEVDAFNQNMSFILNFESIDKIASFQVENLGLDPSLVKEQLPVLKKMIGLVELIMRPILVSSGVDISEGISYFNDSLDVFMESMSSDERVSEPLIRSLYDYGKKYLEVPFDSTFKHKAKSLRPINTQILNDSYFDQFFNDMYLAIFEIYLQEPGFFLEYINGVASFKDKLKRLDKLSFSMAHLILFSCICLYVTGHNFAEGFSRYTAISGIAAYAVSLSIFITQHFMFDKIYLPLVRPYVYFKEKIKSYLTSGKKVPVIIIGNKYDMYNKGILKHVYLYVQKSLTINSKIKSLVHKFCPIVFSKTN